MKKVWSFIAIVVIAVAGCSKKDECPSVNILAPAAEVANLKAYLDANSINATADSRGFFYTIKSAGSADKPTPCQTIAIAYEGKLTNGKVFDNSANATFALSDLITGWQEGIPLIGTGGSIVLYLPPALGYRDANIPGIPPNSILIFTVDLKAFK